MKRELKDLIDREVRIYLLNRNIKPIEGHEFRIVSMTPLYPKRTDYIELVIEVDKGLIPAIQKHYAIIMNRCLISKLYFREIV